MANWQRELNLHPEYSEAREGRLTKQALAGIIAERLKALAPFDDHPEANAERDDIVDMFLGMVDDATLTIENFDYGMSCLYDWADTHLDEAWNGKKACWIRTF